MRLRRNIACERCGADSASMLLSGETGERDSVVDAVEG